MYKKYLIKIMYFITFCLIFRLTAVFVSAAEPGQFITDGSSNIKEAALSFDDGPGFYTDKILAVLKKYGVKATFFMQGSLIERRADIASRVIAEGHEIGSHLYTHPNFYAYKEDDREKLLIDEIDKSEKAFSKVQSLHPVLLRMPHGYVRSWVKDIARDRGYILVNWSFGCDWKKIPEQEMRNSYLEALRPGVIYLMHDGGTGRDVTLKILPGIIEGIIENGYKIVTVGEMITSKSNAEGGN